MEITGWRVGGPSYRVIVSEDADANSFTAPAPDVREVRATGVAHMREPRYAVIVENDTRFLALYGSFNYSVTTRARGSVGTYLIRNRNHRSEAYRLLDDEELLSIEVVPGRKMKEKLRMLRRGGAVSSA